MSPSDTDREPNERRVLVLTPTGKDAALTQSVLQRAGVLCHPCSGYSDLCRELEAGAGAVLIAEEAVLGDGGECVAEWLGRQPPWSDLPILVLALSGADSATVMKSMDLLGNVTVLERPTRIAALVSAVRTALRARQRQYQIRDYLTERERADRRKDEFLAILAHELRNPLAPIRNSLRILGLSNPPDPAAGQVLGMMERQVNQMVRLVDDLLEVSRITRGKIELRKELIDVAAVIRSAVETSTPVIEAAGHQLTLEVPAEPITLEGDPVRLTQVVANLLNNAAKYTDRGGRIRLTTRREGDEVAISVADNGAGIPTELLPRVFEMFTQVDRHAERRGGLGIGLTLVQRLVEMHGGTVQAYSEGLGHGSEFVVRLPVATNQNAAARDQRKVSRPALLSNRRVLVVDDNHDAADSLGMLLRLLQADVRIAYNGPGALEAFASYHPSVVLLDIGMPGMDGYEVARRIRQQASSQSVTLIALTGWGKDVDRNRSGIAGFDHHLVKPADIGTLESLLSSLEAAPVPVRPPRRT